MKSEKGPLLACFGEIHPEIIKKLDLKDPNVYGLEIFLKNIPEPNKKVRDTKKILYIRFSKITKRLCFHYR